MLAAVLDDQKNIVAIAGTKTPNEQYCKKRERGLFDRITLRWVGCVFVWLNEQRRIGKKYSLTLLFPLSGFTHRFPTPNERSGAGVSVQVFQTDFDAAPKAAKATFESSVGTRNAFQLSEFQYSVR
jgi:hypothetical protein